MLRSLFFAGLLALGLLGGCQAPAPPTRPSAANYLARIPDPKTLGETYVSDPDTLLAPGTVDELNRRLDSLDHAGRAHLDVVLVRSIGEAVPKTAAYELFNKWKIGSKEQDNGLLLLLVVDQHRIEFETGYGLEADLPDITCFRIQQRYMLPAARAGHYDQAVQQGVGALIGALRPPATLADLAADSTLTSAQLAERLQRLTADSLYPDLSALTKPQTTAEDFPAEAPVDPRQETVVGIWLIAACSLVLYLVLWSRTTRRYKGREGLLLVPLGLVPGLLLLALGYEVPSTAGQFLGICYGLPLVYLHGYFWHAYRRERRAAAPLSRHDQYLQLTQEHHDLAFTAYLFPVLLAFYWRWHWRRMHQLRDAPYACPECGQPMRKLAGPEEAAYLEPGQQAEEKIEAVDYDVWYCAAGPHYLLLTYPNLDSEARPCPACHHRTFTFRGERQIKAATTFSAGWGWRVHRCHFCQHEQKTKYTIDRLATPSSSSSSSGGSSFSSGGSSSSSSSSSSSGGSSGGGGAGSSW